MTRTESYTEYWNRVDREADKAKDTAQANITRIEHARIAAILGVGEQLTLTYVETNSPYHIEEEVNGTAG